MKIWNESKWYWRLLVLQQPSLSFVASFCWLNTMVLLANFVFRFCFPFCQNHRTNNVISHMLLSNIIKAFFLSMQKYLVVQHTNENCIQRQKFDWSIANKSTSMKLICLHFLENLRKIKWHAIVTHFFFSHAKRIEYWFFRMTMPFFGMHKTINRPTKRWILTHFVPQSGRSNNPINCMYIT